MHLVDISIVTLNQRNDLEQLLPALMRGFDPELARILLLDNRSTDGTRDYVEKNFPVVKYQYNGDVTGYGGNHNRNLKISTAKFFLVVNADVVVEFGQIMALVESMKDNPEVVISTGRVLNPDGSDQGLVKRFPSMAILLARILGLPARSSFWKWMNDRYETRDLGYENSRDTEIVSGAFMLASTNILKGIGGFDERFFLYFEDFDLCLRASNFGKIRYFSNVVVVHHWHRDAHKSLRHTRWFIASAARFFLSHGFRLWRI